MGIMITDVKVVGNCSEHGETMRNRFGEPIGDENISCYVCELASKTEQVK